MSAEKSKGQALLERVADFIGWYMSMPDETRWTVALWCVMTWVSERFDSVGYLSIQGQRGTGKTRMLELIEMLSRNPQKVGDLKVAGLLRDIDGSDGRITVLFDEAEKLSAGAASDYRSVINIGYRKGTTFTRMKPGTDQVMHYKVYCPKAMAQIGDATDTIRSRSIIVRLERGIPKRAFRFAEAEAASTSLVREIEHGGIFKRIPTGEYVDHLTDRDQEIWACMFGTLTALGVDEKTRGLFVRASADLTSMKTAPARYYRQIEAETGAGAGDGIYSLRAMRDLIAVLRPNEKVIPVNEAVQRLHALDAAPWRKFQGKGIDASMLQGLVKSWIMTRMVRIGKQKEGKGQPTVRGYSGKELREVAAKIGVAEREGVEK